ncbi:MAG TPA: universal stress protein, partial [Acidobacteriota bacterium]|nr:universal stress protein [Acidobacteriota bacterium]
MKVLMATDGSLDALTAMRAAAQLVRKENSQVQVVCVIPELFQAKSQTREAGEQSRRARDRY